MGSWATEQDVRDFMDIKGSEKDGLIGSLIPMVQNLIENYCDRVFDSSLVTEYYNGGRSKIFVKNPPIDSVTLVEIWDDPDRVFPTSTKLDATDYAVSYEDGIISCEYPLSEGLQGVKVTYKGGYSIIPKALKQALIEWVAFKIKLGTQGELGVASRSTPSGSITYEKDSIPPSVKVVLDFFRL